MLWLTKYPVRIFVLFTLRLEGRSIATKDLSPISQEGLLSQAPSSLRESRLIGSRGSVPNSH